MSRKSSGSHSPVGSPELVAPSSLPSIPPIPEVSMVEESTVTGVSFTPELWMQRRHWALDVLRSEGVRSVLDMGCGAGALLETLVIPPSTVPEPPIRPAPPAKGSSQLPSPVDSDYDDEFSQTKELFITRLGGLDASTSVITPALSVLAAPSPTASFPPPRPRWEALNTELWLGGIEKYNSRLEGYEAIVALELIEHLDPNVLSRFGVVTMGTYRPRLLLVSTPNFDFNAKFPRAEEQDFAKKGFVDPTGRTDRVFRHSDHKLEMTSKEFREWAEGAAADWGYTVEISGVGVSSAPSFYPQDDPSLPPRPIFATQTAIFRMGTGLALRSPRSVRTIELPFMPGSAESRHPHKLAGRSQHPISCPGDGTRQSPAAVQDVVRGTFEQWNVGEVSLDELWSVYAVSGAAGGSKRHLVGSLGGWGDCPALPKAETSAGGVGEREFEVRKEKGRPLSVRWTKWVPPITEKQVEWGKPMEVETGHGSDSPAAGGW